MISSGARRLHIWLAWLFVFAVLIQTLLAGLAIFGAVDGFTLHVEFGYTVIGILTLFVLLAAVIGRLPGLDVALSFLLLVLYVVQTALPAARAALPILAALHPVNAIVLFALGVTIARRGSGVGRPRASS